MRFANIREQALEKRYKELGIQTPYDLSIDNLSSLFKIKVIYHEDESECFYDDNCALMYLDSRVPQEYIRLDFFHEMSHFTQHVGDQRYMNVEFEKLQETQAHWISMYLSMPRYIFEPIMNDVRSIRALVDIFELPESMIRERVRIIRQQNKTEAFYSEQQQREQDRINRSLQKGKVYKSTIAILDQLKRQVGEENLSYDVKNLLR
ncbi:ImmA/IrrE family metallo-endopeptidase [Halalkalibacter krulwichiae]|uniref:ImmA/IrrE family metallo-endopeptidase n=1 Tax=Halalkalibacter krulwichiae TaxID=199441 RepID=UPI001470BC43|nr:ImmA/IrrE family metallo-endopeptidase [Halalkalibacter krulwichiae]